MKGRGGVGRLGSEYFIKKELKKINSHIQNNPDIQDYFNEMARNGVFRKKRISYIQKNPDIEDQKLESSFRNNLQC